MTFTERTYKVVSSIPAGRVATYGLVALAAGSPRAARAVGQILHFNPLPGIIPCHRVVARDGSLSGSFAFGGPHEQQRLLEAEGVDVHDGIVNLDLYLDQELPARYLLAEGAPESSAENEN